MQLQEAKAQALLPLSNAECNPAKTLLKPRVLSRGLGALVADLKCLYPARDTSAQDAVPFPEDIGKSPCRTAET